MIKRAGIFRNIFKVHLVAVIHLVSPSLSQPANSAFLTYLVAFWQNRGSPTDLWDQSRVSTREQIAAKHKMNELYENHLFHKRSHLLSFNLHLSRKYIMYVHWKKKWLNIFISPVTISSIFPLVENGYLHIWWCLQNVEFRYWLS